MKRIVFLLAVFAVISGALGAQDQGVAPQAQPSTTQRQQPGKDFYTLQFDMQATLERKLGVVKSAASSGEGTTAFYAYALDTLVKTYPNVRGANETNAADEMALILAARLGEAEYTEAGPNLWSVVQAFSAPLVRAEALAAMGKVQAVQFLPQVVQLLSDYNQDQGSNPREREQVSYGAIIALEEYKDSSGYLPVFFATIAWYTERVKSRAKEALPKILDNPTESLVSVIKSSSYNYQVKYTALQVLEAADVTTQQKSQGAVAALTESWRNTTASISQRSILANMRKFALSMIRRYGTEDANVYPALSRCYKEGIDPEEQIGAIKALEKLATDDSVRILSGFLNDINVRLASGALTREDERLVREIIPSLGATGRPSAKEALRTVTQYGWTSAVLKLAQDNMKKLP
ncbi:MAG: hypothetical protein LBG84_08230 [Treponema sp.]|jgi:HEAT repeat protein|nr:hypothetical protein [Treponema sp.]